MICCSLPPYVGGSILGEVVLEGVQLRWRKENSNPPHLSSIFVKWWGEKGGGSKLEIDETSHDVVGGQLLFPIRSDLSSFGTYCNHMVFDNFFGGDFSNLICLLKIEICGIWICYQSYHLRRG